MKKDLRKQAYQDIVDQYDLGMITANEVINAFVAAVDEPTANTPKVNPVAAAVVQERERLLSDLAGKCAQMLELMAK